jgi:hypothetical protein
MSNKPTSAPAQVEATARFKHDGVDRVPGEVVAMSTEQAAELVAVGFAKPVEGYARRDMTAKQITKG